MAYIFLDDGGPEADDYANNYLYFDGTNSQTVEKIIGVLSYGDTSDPAVRKRLIDICQSRQEVKPERNHGYAGADRIKSASGKQNIFSQQTQRIANLFLRRNVLDNRKTVRQPSTYGTVLGT